MPETRAVGRLVALLQALTPEWEDRAELLARAGDYPADDESARRMFTRDIAQLRQLGFQVERSPGHHRPLYRLAGHEHWPATYAPLAPALTERQAEIVRLHEVDGLTFAAIAERLGVRPQVAYGAYKAARKKRRE